MKLAVLALFAALIASPASARAPEWVELGDHKVALFEKDDLIQVGRDDGAFTRIRFEVYGNDIEIRDVRIRFLNGEEQVISVNRRIREGTASPEFDLPGRRRGIQAIALRYGERPLFGGKPRIKVFGLREDFGPPPGPAPGGPLAGRPAILDTQTVRNDDDRIEFNVGAEHGMVHQIRLRAVDGNILYRAVEVMFGNNQTQMIDGLDRIEAGEQGKAIDLDGDRRFVRKVVVFKRPSWKPGSTRVELLGLVSPRPAPPAPPPRPVPPIAGDFDVIDQQVVDRRSDEVLFSADRGEGPFRQIKFKSLDDAILFRKIQIVFRSGKTQNFDIVERLEAGEESPALDVDAPGDIDKVIVTKRPSWKAGESRLQLAGLEGPRRPPPAPPRPSGPPSHGYPGGWVLIGAGDLVAGGRPAYLPPQTSIPGAESKWDREARERARNAGPAAQTAIIRIGGREVGQFKSIGLRLLGGDVQVNGVTIVYGNGERDRVALSATLSDRTRTQPIQLRGERFIREIEVEYMKRREDRSTIEIYGDYADNWLGERGRRRDHNQGWVLLGSQRAQLFGTDLDAFHVGQRYGAFRAVRFAVRDHSVRFYGLRIYYGDGTSEDVPYSGELGAGQSTPPLDLKGRRSFIERIDVKYRTKLNFQGDGIVEVWGMQ